MYYNVEEINYALTKATEIINERTVNKGFIRSYSDCFCFLIEYDKALRNNKSKADEIFKKLKYNNAKEFLIELRKNKLNLKTFAIYSGYEIRSNLRPKHGDIAYTDGTAMIANNGHWVTTDEKNSGVVKGTKLKYREISVHLLARPLRKEL
jgi:hypothetical protein